MPTITAFPDQTNAWVRVEVNWADTPAVTHARVLRYNTVTGECVPLRPYVCYDGDYLLLSCGHGIFFDTEMPLDTEVYYITEGLDAPCLPASSILLDNFNRNNAVDWGSPDIGSTPWQYISTNPGQATVTVAGGGRGRMEFDVAGDVAGTFAGDTTSHVSVIAHMLPDELITGAGPADIGVATNVLEPAGNRYEFLIRFQSTGLIDVRVNRSLGGVVTILSTATTSLTYTAASMIGLRAEVDGPNLRMKVWDAAGPEPDGIWNLTTTDPSPLPAGSVGTYWRVQAGNTNVPDYFPAIGYIEATDLCLPCTLVTADTSLDPTTILAGGVFRLRDPVRPCHDQAVPLCFTQANAAMNEAGYCIPGNGIFFASMDNEDYEPNTLTLNPTNAKYPLAMSRTRRGVSSLLTLVTRTFTDRDNLLTLAEPGSPLFWQGPAAYGIPDQYMDVGRVSIQRGLSDHKFQVRVAQLPYTSVARPAGPSQGVCGSQVGDLCDFTWDELAAEGFTWDDLIRGRATGGLPAYRTWDDVQADFADWNAVDNGTRTWTDLEVGL